MDKEIEDLKKENRVKQGKIEELGSKVELVTQSETSLKFDINKVNIEKDKLAEKLKKV